MGRVAVHGTLCCVFVTVAPERVDEGPPLAEGHECDPRRARGSQALRCARWCDARVAREDAHRACVPQRTENRRTQGPHAGTHWRSAPRRRTANESPAHFRFACHTRQYAVHDFCAADAYASRPDDVARRGVRHGPCVRRRADWRPTGRRRRISHTVWRDFRCNGPHLAFPTCVSALKSRCTSRLAKSNRAASRGPAVVSSCPFAKPAGRSA
jgi:hypothetical protein